MKPMPTPRLPKWATRWELVFWGAPPNRRVVAYAKDSNEGKLFGPCRKTERGAIYAFNKMVYST